MTSVSQCVRKADHDATGQALARDTRRLQTRQRILGAAIVEFKRSGMAAADVGEIVSAAGVAHGTFYFHFPTKEHVLLELEWREEARIAAGFTRFLENNRDLAAALTEVVDLVAGLEQRLGSPLFKELLALHFSPSRPHEDEWTDHPVDRVIGPRDRAGTTRRLCRIQKSTRSTARCSSFSVSTESADQHRQPRSPRHDAGRVGRFCRARSGGPMSTSRLHNPITGGLEMNWIWEILRYVAAWGGTGLIIWFWYWMFSSIGTF